MSSPKLMHPFCVIAFSMIAISAAAARTGADVLSSATSSTAAPAIVAQVCAACHGSDGNSVDPQVPSLAGQGASYLERQLDAFKAQRRSGVMSAMAMDLGDTDMRAAAAWFAQQVTQPNPDPWPDSDALRRGAAIYRHGIPTQGVPACASCHALEGSGLPPEFPRLAGQRANYLGAQLRAFRSGDRLSNPNAMMREISARLSDDEIDAVVQYIADLR